LEDLNSKLLTVQNGIDFLVPIETLISILSQAGFKNIYTQDIGQHVWKGFDTWIAQGNKKESWVRNSLKLYEQKQLDYYFLFATK
jgi:hypothetical protein